MRTSARSCHVNLWKPSLARLVKSEQYGEAAAVCTAPASRHSPDLCREQDALQRSFAGLYELTPMRWYSRVRFVAMSPSPGVDDRKRSMQSMACDVRISLGWARGRGRARAWVEARSKSGLGLELALGTGLRPEPWAG